MSRSLVSLFPVVSVCLPPTPVRNAPNKDTQIEWDGRGEHGIQGHVAFAARPACGDAPHSLRVGGAACVSSRVSALSRINGKAYQQS
eukprot:scaffold82494_cov63-Phaeocystis_antarctica.AAC.2